ncbi:MAG: c-type cytochrome [Candidatus Nitronauta litoralis]|uniref:C-type cytochrome n=1 Tax=Candidatus Nitronauta litoralis TaxID=2705533 RepID=A0A7T0BZ01_9BACT|nr:MAG: c-type cytochrome [Candidatus Nitronauta litoralis]
MPLIVCIFQSTSVWAFNPPGPEDVPTSINVKGKQYDLKSLSNPFWKDAAKIPEIIKQGSELYFKHCVLCHGDLLNGKGVFSNRFSPAPANFHKQGSVFDRPEGYTFWRIMKGGPGLPKKYEPWNSAMPAWEGVLSEEEVWKLILFLFDEVARPLTPETPQEASLERGQVVYEDKCAVCHGLDGKADTPPASLMSPRPRNLIKGHYKLRSTPFGKIPTDPDLHDMLVRGYPETTMPSWRHLPKVDLDSLVLYLKELGKKKFDRAKRKKKFPAPIIVPPAPPFTLESQERGRELFVQNCSGCHGVEGRGDGDSTKKIVNLASDAIRPRNLTKPWTFRRGSRREDLFLTLRTGLSTTAMPRFSDRIHPDKNIWDLVNYISTLSLLEKPRISNNLKMTRVDGALPENPDDPAWNKVDSFFVPLSPQIMQGNIKTFTTTDSLWVQALHNGNEMAIRVRWDDPTFDPILKKSIKVVESPPPPLPEHLRVMEGEEDEEPPPPLEPAAHPDMLAIQLAGPGSSMDDLPYFLNGDANHPVTLWKWQSHPNRTDQVSVAGLGNETPITNTSALISNAQFQYGQYTLVIKKTLDKGEGSDGAPLKSGGTIPVAFNAWDGGEEETGDKRSVSNWYYLKVE